MPTRIMPAGATHIGRKHPGLRLSACLASVLAMVVGLAVPAALAGEAVTPATIREELGSSYQDYIDDKGRFHLAVVTPAALLLYQAEPDLANCEVSLERIQGKEVAFHFRDEGCTGRLRPMNAVPESVSRKVAEGLYADILSFIRLYEDYDRRVTAPEATTYLLGAEAVPALYAHIGHGSSMLGWLKKTTDDPQAQLFHSQVSFQRGPHQTFHALARMAGDCHFGIWRERRQDRRIFADRWAPWILNAWPREEDWPDQVLYTDEGCDGAVDRLQFGKRAWTVGKPEVFQRLYDRALRLDIHVPFAAAKRVFGKYLAVDG